MEHEVNNGGIIASVAAGILLVALGSGCGADDLTPESTRPAAEPTSTGPTPDSKYGTVEELREAAVDAGLYCKRWRQPNAVALAAESGSCSGDDVLATYASEGDLQRQLDQEKENSDMLAEYGIEETPVLVGPNWTIKSPDAPGLQEELGGTVVSG
jgi:hypothetical protein